MGLQYGIKEVFDSTFWDFATNKPFLFVDYATASSNEFAAERLDLRGGQGNPLLLSFDHTKTSTLKLTIPMVDLKLLAYLGGESLVTGTANVYKREELTISGGSATLSDAPVNDSQVVFEATGVRDLGTEFTKVGATPNAGEYSITGSTLTFNAADDGKKIVVWYQYATSATANKISFKANKFPNAVKITGQGLWRDQEYDVDKAVAIEVFKAKAQPNFTLTTSSSDATNLEITFDMYGQKAANGDLQYIDYVIL